MDERLQALIDALADDETRDEGLAELSDEQIAATTDELKELFTQIRNGEVDGVDARDVAALRSIRDAVKVLETEAETRATAAAEVDAELAELTAELDGENDAAEAETVEEAAEEESEESVEPEAELVEAAVEPAPRKARRAPLAALAAHVPPAARPQPNEMVAKPRWQLRNGKGTDLSEISERFAEAARSIDFSTPVAMKIPVVQLNTELDSDHNLSQLEQSDLQATMRKIEAVTAAAYSPEDWTEEQRAIVASGGWCAPAEPRYTIPGIVSTARPFRDSLARITANRGTINFVRAARVATILANTTGAAITTWENTTDEVPGESTKTRQAPECRTIQEEELGAVVARTRFGNFRQRAFPEEIAHELELVMGRHARVAEVRLLDALIADVAVDVAQTGLLGTARDAKHHLMQAARNMQYVERSTVNVRAAVSDVLPSMVVADITFQQASGNVDALLVDDAWARRMLATSGLVFSYLQDVPTGADAFVTNSDGENLADWPDDFEIPLFFDGTVLFADGGTLDLGIIRDGTLNSTNDFEVFMETFEGLLYLGPHAETLTLTTCPNGESQVATDETGSLCSGS